MNCFLSLTLSTRGWHQNQSTNLRHSESVMVSCVGYWDGIEKTPLHCSLPSSVCRHPLLPSALPSLPSLSPSLSLPPSHHAGMQLKAAPDEVVMGQMRDWNEELQAARELPVDTPQLKVFRDRTIYKVSRVTE